MPSDLGYDIFKKVEDGSAIWLGDAATLEEAKRKLDAFRAAKPGAYFVRDAATGEIVSRQLGTLDSACA
jgi:hypothetical protein